MTALPTLKKRTLAAGLALLLLAGCATSQNQPQSHDLATHTTSQSQQSQAHNQQAYHQNELVAAVSDHLGVTSESAASAIERMFKDRGRPVGYITGEEAGGAFAFGARYGKGTLWMKDGRTQPLYWQGPTVGFDIGGEASKVFTLVYGLNDPNYIYQRFPGVDGSAYLVAGMAINYQRANGVTLAPVRAGVGARLGANIGYTSYTRKRNILPI